jgi:hypothetical protein
MCLRAPSHLSACIVAPGPDDNPRLGSIQLPQALFLVQALKLPQQTLTQFWYYGLQPLC